MYIENVEYTKYNLNNKINKTNLILFMKCRKISSSHKIFPKFLPNFSPVIKGIVIPINMLKYIFQFKINQYYSDI